MNAHTDEWLLVGSVDDIPERGARCVHHGDTTIALFRTRDNQIFALEDKCPHKKGQLSQGIVHGNCVTCPLHNWVISLENGAAQGADDGWTPAYPVRVEGRQIYLDITANQLVR